MMKKIVLLLVLILSAFALFACNNVPKLPADLYIVASDVTDIAPSDDYYLPHTINKYNEYKNKYNLSLKITVYNRNDNTPVLVNNNMTMKVEVETVYDVIVRVDGLVDNTPCYVTASYSVTTRKADRTVTFMKNDKDVEKKFTVPYGSNFNEDEIPEVPDTYTSQEGFYTEIESKKWVGYDEDGKEFDLDYEKHLVGIKENVIVYPSYKYKSIPLEFTLTFDVDGGDPMNSYEGDAATVIPRPSAPTKTGYTFVGWCEDKERTVYFNWQLGTKLTQNMTLYAKFVKNTQNPTASNKFNFDKATDPYGNDYYVISASDVNNLNGSLVIPNNYNGLPVRDIKEYAFKGSAITSAYIPATCNLTGQYAFRDCALLEEVIFEENNVSATVVSTGFFAQCYLLESIELPDTIEYIRQNAFANCGNLRTVKLPSKLKSLNERAFYGCRSLTAVSIPDSTISILSLAFGECSALDTVEINKESLLHDVENDILSGTLVTEITLPYRLQKTKPLDGTGITVRYHEEVKTEEDKEEDKKEETE